MRRILAAAFYVLAHLALTAQCLISSPLWRRDNGCLQLAATHSLTYATTENTSTVVYLTDVLGLDSSTIRSLEDTTIGALKQQAEWLQLRLGLVDSELRMLVRELPQLLYMPKLGERLAFLQNRLRRDKPSLKKTVIRAPNILLLDVNSDVAPALDWLQQRLDLTDHQLNRIIKSMPTIVNLICENRDAIETKMNWLQGTLGVDNKKLGFVLCHVPTFITMSDESLEPKICWLKRRLSISEDEVLTMMRENPSLLASSIEFNLQPKLNFLDSVLGKEEAGKLIRANPVVLNCSMKRRYEPRLSDARRVGLDIDASLIRKMGMNNDKQWQTLLQKCAPGLETRGERGRNRSIDINAVEGGELA